VTLKARLGVTQGHRNRHVSIHHLWLPINIPWQHTISDTYGDFSRKSQIFPIPVYFVPPLKGFPLELDIGTWESKKTRIMGYWAEQELFDNIFSHLGTTHQCDTQTPADSKDRADTQRRMV